jgi:hypothetical protein
MRKYCYLGTAIVTALIAALPLTSAAAATRHVLTTGKAGGTAVKVDAVLKASLVKGTKAKFTSSLGTLSCAKSAFSAKVATNPTKPGTAKESLTAETFSKCTITISGVTIKSLTVKNLPYKGTVSDAKGDPVTVSEQKKAKPLEASITVSFEGSTFTCGIKATSIKGAASNTGNKVTFSKQKFVKSSGPSLCPASALFSASYGPVTDSSVKGSPKVFVN